MAHTAHTRGPGTRYARRATWDRAFIGHASRPARVERRTARGEIEQALADLDLAGWDPEVLLWGGTLATEKIARERNQNLQRGLLTRGPQLDLIEVYFEVGRMIDAQYRLPNRHSPIRHKPSRDRLVMIMENIISNRGTFDPMRGAHCVPKRLAVGLNKLPWS